MGDLTLITGGARSGKSTFAESLAARAGCPVTYVATLDPLDEEMRDRIARHRTRRPDTWHTVEAIGATHDLAATARAAGDDDLLLVDCIAVWTSNRLLALHDESPTVEALDALDAAVAKRVTTFLEAITARRGPTIVVTNEVGDGVVPPYALGRAYRDLLGRVNQQVSRAADRAYLVVAGRPLLLPAPFEAGSEAGSERAD